MKIIRLSDATSLPPSQSLTPEELAKAYELARAAFTAEDLQRYTELDEGVPAEELLAELEEVQRHFDQANQ